MKTNTKEVNRIERYFSRAPFWKRLLIVLFFFGCLGLIIVSVEGLVDSIYQVTDLFIVK